MKPRSALTLPVCLLLAAALAFASCGGGGGAGSRADRDLALARFLLVDEEGDAIGGTGTSDAIRDARVLLVFNTDVDAESISTRTVRIGIPVPGGLWLEAEGDLAPVPGKPNQVLFDPTVPHPSGFQSDSLYEVYIPSAGDQEKVLTNESGRPITDPFLASFTTGRSYFQNFHQPEVVSTSPEDGDIDISPTADIVVEFTEAMREESFRLGESVVVRNLTTDRDVLGTLRLSGDGTQLTFRPVFGYGKGPYDIFLRITRDVTNLPGNSIPKELRIQFRTAFSPIPVEFGDVTVTFEDSAGEDTSFTSQYPRADWNVGTTSGYLAGKFTSGTVTLTTAQSVIILPPWAVAAPATERWQALFYASEVGGIERVITGFDWLRYCTTANSVSGVTIRMGHTQSGSLSTSFGANYSDSPVTCVSNVSYTIPTGSRVWRAAPTFSGSFVYNGKDNLILEISHAGAARGTTGSGNGEWYGYDPASGPQRVAYTFPTGTSPRTNDYSYDTRFHYLIERSEAQSLWYDTGQRNPTYLDALVRPDLESQPAGTVTVLTFQGAPEDLANPGVPDESSATDWEDSMESIGGSRFFRFHAVFRGNRATSRNPAIDSLTFPFVYY